MLRLFGKTVVRTTNTPSIKYALTAAKGLHMTIPLYQFGSDPKDKKPKGFEKFQRRRRSSEDKKAKENGTEAEDSKQKQTEGEKEVKQEEESHAQDVNEKEKIRHEGEANEEKIEKESRKDDKKNQNEQPPKFNSTRASFIAIVLGLVFIQPLIEYYREIASISYAEFVKDYLNVDGAINKIVIVQKTKDGFHRHEAIIHTNKGSAGEKLRSIPISNVDHFIESLEKYQLDRGVQPEKLIPLEFRYDGDTNLIIDRVINVLSALAGVGMLYAVTRTLSTLTRGGKGGGNMFGLGESNVKVFGVNQKVATRFKDVAGLSEAKQEIMEFVEFLKKPKRFEKLGAKIPRGALLTGPPGVGKTLLAKAAAGEAGVPFLYVSGSDFVEMFVGVGASRVRDLFKQAKKHSPSIIFIDEIDAVGRKRDTKLGGNDERETTLNQLLVEMDGFGTDSNVVVLAATNRKELLDSALTRPGRFDRTIEVELPDIKGREEIFMVHLKPLKLDTSKTIEAYAKRLATLTPGFSGADIANLCNEAAILAARKNQKYVTSENFEMATERVLAGLEKKKIISTEEKKIVALHESGHAVVSWFLKGGLPLLKITIIPRSKGSLGFAQYLPSESSLQTREELIDQICCILGGRIAEEVFRGKITTGAADDLQKIFDLAYSVVTKFGMSEKIGYIGLPDHEYLNQFSDYTSELIDDEIRRIVNECTERTRQLISEHREHIEKLSAALLEKETLDLQAITEILGERPFLPKSHVKEYLKIKKEMDEEKHKSPSPEDSQEEPKEEPKEEKTA